MIRAVLDTNVYVAAVLSRRGAPARLMRALADGRFDAVVCPHLIAELAGVLARPGLTARLGDWDARPYVQWIERVAIVEPDPVHVPPLSPDPHDDYLWALAHASGARVVVSGDEHVLRVDVPGIRALTVAAFARLVEALP